MVLSLALATYEPATLISDSRHWTLLQSPDSVRDISGFYAAELTRCGWRITSSVVTVAAARVVARLGPHGATISIDDTGTGTAITITSY
jgi:hypothetical protein